nr:energy transducer TonB [Pseudoxanthomonas sp.]
MKSRGYRILPVLLALGACQPSAPVAVTSAPSAQASAPAVSPDGAIDNSELLRLAAQALQAQRLYAPAGDNAVEFYLAARARRPDDTAIRAALTELQPYLLIATEQALERRDGIEAARLFELLRRLDPQAPALPRLQAGLTALPAAPETVLAPPAIPLPNAPAVPAVSPAASAQPPRPSGIATASPPPTTLERPTPDEVVMAPVSTATASPPPAPARAATPSAPRLLQDAQPRYPLPALRNRLEGEVELAFVIRPDGSVGDVRLTAAQPQGVFDAAAVAVASRWRFEATGRSQAWQRTVRFRLPPQ